MPRSHNGSVNKRRCSSTKDLANPPTLRFKRRRRLDNLSASAHNCKGKLQLDSAISVYCLLNHILEGVLTFFTSDY